jgi:hypothetical protein
LAQHPAGDARTQDLPSEAWTDAATAEVKKTLAASAPALSRLGGSPYATRTTRLADMESKGCRRQERDELQPWIDATAAVKIIREISTCVRHMLQGTRTAQF